MQITLVQGLLIALLVFICAIDKHMETFMLSLIHISEPTRPY